MRQRLLYLGKFFLLTAVLFIAAKVVFMLANAEGHAFTVDDVWDVITHGLLLDLSTALYLLIIPFLVTVVSYWWDGKVLVKILRVYYCLIAIALIMAFVADTSLYPFWGFKLDASCLQYLETPAEARASVSGPYLTIRLVIIILGAVLIYLLYHRIPLWKKQPANRNGSALTNLLLIPVFIIGIRGGLDE